MRWCCQVCVCVYIYIYIDIHTYLIVITCSFDLILLCSQVDINVNCCWKTELPVTFPLPPLLWHSSSWRAGLGGRTSRKVLSDQKKRGGVKSEWIVSAFTGIHNELCYRQKEKQQKYTNWQNTEGFCSGDHGPDLVHIVLLGREPKVTQVGEGTCENWAELCCLAAEASRGLWSICTPCQNVFTVVDIF